MIVLLDLNVLLDLMLNRAPWAVDAAAVWRAHEQGLLRAHLSSASLPTIFYVIRRQASRLRAFQAVDECVQSLHVVNVDRQTIATARNLNGIDFEDDLQIACAIEAGASAIVTRDCDGFRHSPVLALSPDKLLPMILSNFPDGAH